MSAGFDPYYKWLGIAPEEQPPDHYRLFGLRAFENDPDVIETAADRLMAQLRTYQAGKHSALSQKLLNEVAAAKICLLNPQKKADYDAKLHELLDRQSSGEDTSTQLKGLQELGELLAQDLARPTPKPRAKGSNLMLFAVVGAVVVAAALAAWVWNSRKSEVGVRKAEVAAIEGQRRLETEGQRHTGTEVQSRTGKMSNDQIPMTKGSPAASLSTPPSTIQNPQSKISAPAPLSVSATPRATPSGSSTALASGAKPPAPASTLAPPSTLQNPPSAISSPAPNPSASPAPSPQPPTPSPQPLAPIPDEASRAAALKEAQQLYRDEYDKAKKPSEKAELSRKILKQAEASAAASTERYVLLCLARDVAVLAEDDALCTQAIDALSKSFAVDAVALKLEVLQALAKSAKTLPAHKHLCEQALSLGREALQNDQFAAADALAKLAYAEAGKVRDKELVQRSRNLAKEQQDAFKAFAAVEEAFKTLREKPDDPAANLVAGRYLCLAKGNWTKGLPLLTQGADVRLKAIAVRERALEGPPAATPKPGAGSLPLADSWWDFAEREHSNCKSAILARAGYWYKAALEEETTASGLERTRIEKRLAEINKLGCVIPDRYPPKSFTNSIGMKLVLIPAGTFDMGTSDEDLERLRKEEESTRGSKGYLGSLALEKPRHPVRITKPFYLGVFEVTQAEYTAVMKTNPSKFAGPRKPVEVVTWEDAVQFCRQLSELPEEKAQHRTYRLPTEAEWEYAARAGSAAIYCSGNDATLLEQYAWFADNSGSHTNVVGQKKPNPWGLYDTSGNVSEWCADIFSHTYYGSSPMDDPAGPASGNAKVLRGSSFLSQSNESRLALRRSYAISFRYSTIGLRAACSVAQEAYAWREESPQRQAIGTP